MIKQAAIAGVFLFSVASQAAVLRIGSTDRKYPEVKAFVRQLAAENPDKVKLFSLGVSDSKDEVLGLKIGTGPVHNLLVSTHHGNEYASAELALAFAESAAKEPIAGQTLYVIPVLNIGGYNSRSREESNDRGAAYDPNRNYPSPCGTEGPFTLKSTKALADLLASEKIVTSATLHSYYPAVVYPWGISSHDLDTRYPEILKKLVSDATVESRYRTGNSSEVIYPADGTFEDYAFMQHGIWSILFELGYSHTPGESEIQAMIAANLPGLRRMFASAPTQNAADHAFKGKCDLLLKSRDRHDE
jgi:predicted deacylase